MDVYGFIISVFSAVLAVVSVILTVQAIRNGRWMKQAHLGTQALIKEGREETQALLAKMDERTAKMDERHTRLMEQINTNITEARRDAAQAHERTDALIAEARRDSVKIDEHITEARRDSMKIDEHIAEARRSIVSHVEAEGQKTRAAMGR